MKQIANFAKRASAIFVLCAVTAIALTAQTFATLFSFDGTNGAIPTATPVQGTDGNLYGTTSEGGAANLSCTNTSGTPVTCGTVFRISPSGTLTTLHTFCSLAGCADGGTPMAGLVQGADGNFYGTTRGQLGYQDSVFKITPSGTLTRIYNFPCSESACPNGSQPFSGLVQGPNGDLYGTTYAGGANGYSAPCFFGCGTIFDITPSGTLTTLYSFCAQSGCADGFYPMAGLVQAGSGDFYGTTIGGGACSDGFGGTCGTVFKINPSGMLTTLSSENLGALVQGNDGNLYGAYETIVKITSNDTVTAYPLSCSVGPCAGLEVSGALVQGTDGNLYATTQYGGANCAPSGCGTIIKITPSGTVTVLYSFCSLSACADGANPVAGLVQHTNGNFYGTTQAGGANDTCMGGETGGPATAGCGTVFSLSVGLPPFVRTLPTSGNVGAAVQILGTNLTGATSVTFNGTPAAFTVVSPSLITTTVPTGATTGNIQVITPSGTLLSNAAFLVEDPAPPFTVALSTAGQVEPFAAQSIVSAYVLYGANLATGTASTPSLPLPTSLDGTTVTVTDPAGVARIAPLFYVSPSQINFEIPASSATGTASVSIQSQNGTTQTATIQIGSVSPGLFELNGSGLVAAWVLPVISGTQQPLQPVYQVVSGAVVPLPIYLGPSTEQIYLEMYGTGIRNANSVTATVGGLSAPVLYAGPAPGFAGEDQVNIGPLPQSLAGAGIVSILLTADGQAASPVNVRIQ
jgi:uncharacterized protein (TIGR03437 family)